MSVQIIKDLVPDKGDCMLLTDVVMANYFTITDSNKFYCHKRGW